MFCYRIRACKENTGSKIERNSTGNLAFVLLHEPAAFCAEIYECTFSGGFLVTA